MYMTHKQSSRRPAYVIPTLIGLAALCGTMVWAAAAVAQSWPQTFQGQPDFDFSRDEVVSELEKRKFELGFEPYIATINDLVQARDVDPFRPRPRYRVDQAANQNVNPFLPRQLLGNNLETDLEQPELTLPNPAEVSTEAATLESTKVDTKIDFDGFEKMLTRLANANAKLKDPDLSKMDLTAELKKLTLQSITMSPQRYASINNRRYTEGDRFTILVALPGSFDDISKLLEAQLPNTESVTEENYAKYKQMVEQANTNYTRMMKEKAAKVERRRVSVSVTQIESRRIILTISGQNYALKLGRIY